MATDTFEQVELTEPWNVERTRAGGCRAGLVDQGIVTSLSPGDLPAFVEK